MNARWIGATWRSLSHGCCGNSTANSILTTAPRNFSVSACQLLFSQKAMGLTEYVDVREKTTEQMGTMKERFKQKLDGYLSGNSAPLILTEDLRKMCYVAEDEKDLQTLKKMLKKYSKQHTDKRFAAFAFGPVIMRLYHHLNKPDEALAAIQDPELRPVYDQLTSYTVAMDLLYENQRYADVLTLYKIMLERPFIGNSRTMFRINLTLACAAGYQLGTPAAHKTVMDLVKRAIDRQALLMRRAVAFAAALALKNNDAAGALEVLNFDPSQHNHKSLRNLLVLSLTKLDRLEDVLPIFSGVTVRDSASKPTWFGLFSDVIAEVKKAVETKDNPELRRKFDAAFKNLEENDAIDSQTLETYLVLPIQFQSSENSERQGQDFGDRRLSTPRSDAALRQPRYRNDDRPQMADRRSADRPAGGGDWAARKAAERGQRERWGWKG
ncbi:pentatricopeptide repeat-containing protein 2, mitochondrial-like [Paramacrobiotus metropolitanus]|uniref:pentatricopeptide repeat-containing protein 2, mitochondrial-like n=1 Tax=Paramacrobiotus metropolitanus TaxID=2943436 RepID=UPI002445B976|nr:pentatricopeptide repeat-containing protein 2, mitochondrial-like [Paramacrobiotus metropolitanus]